jgi:hypothetical protein
VKRRVISKISARARRQLLQRLKLLINGRAILKEPSALRKLCNSASNAHCGADEVDQLQAYRMSESSRITAILTGMFNCILEVAYSLTFKQSNGHLDAPTIGPFIEAIGQFEMYRHPARGQEISR